MVGLQSGGDCFIRIYCWFYYRTQCIVYKVPTLPKRQILMLFLAAFPVVNTWKPLFDLHGPVGDFLLTCLICLSSKAHRPGPYQLKSLASIRVEFPVSAGLPELATQGPLTAPPAPQEVFSPAEIRLRWAYRCETM